MHEKQIDGERNPQMKACFSMARFSKKKLNFLRCGEFLIETLKERLFKSAPRNFFSSKSENDQRVKTKSLHFIVIEKVQDSVW